MMMRGGASGLIKGPLPMMVAQPRMMVRQQPAMMMVQQQQPMMYSGAVGGSGTQVRNIQVSPLVHEQHIIQTTRKVIRKTKKPVKKQVGTKMVDTFETVEVKNPSTMRMSTEYAEPYIKRDGYVQENCGVIGRTTKVIRRGQTMTRQTTMPIVTTQVNPGMTRGYTRID